MAVVIPLPRLYVDGKFRRIMHPVSVSITDNMIPLSTASMVLQDGEEMPFDSWVELFTPYGSAGMYRFRAPDEGYGEDTTTAEMEHMIAEVGDHNVKDEIDEMMPASAAAQRLFSYYDGGLWKLGKVSDLGDGKVAVEAKYDSILTGLLSILHQTPDCMMAFDFTTTPWTLNIVKKGTKVVSEGRITRNMDGAKVKTDRSTLVTRVWYQTWSEDAEGNVIGTWTHRDADTLKTYGNKPVERRLDTNYSMTGEEINQMVDTYIQEHKHPRTSVSIKAKELWRITGERVDRFIVGDLFRLAIQKYGLNLEMNIISIVWQDVYNHPDDVIVHLGDEEDTVVTFLHNLDATGEGISGGSGGGGGRAKREDEWKEFRSKWEVQDNKIEGYVQRVDKSEKILEQAGLQIDSKGVLIYADNGTDMTLFSKFKVANDRITQEVTDRRKVQDQLNTKITQTSEAIKLEATRRQKAVGDLDSKLTGKINVQAGKISLVVEEKNGQDVIKSASIMTAINADGSQIKLSADRIDLSGYVTVSNLDATNGRINNLVSGDSAFTNIVTAGLSAASFKLVGASISTQSATIGGQTIRYLGW